MRKKTFEAEEHILVCLSPSPSNPKIIKTAARMADAFKGNFTALFVETPDFPSMSEDNKKNLHENIRLAKQLGARIEILQGDDPAFLISEFVRISSVSKIVVGRSSIKRKFLFGKSALIEKLISYIPELDIYIIPDQNTPSYREKKVRQYHTEDMLADIMKSLSVLLATTILGLCFSYLGIREANIVTIYILGVLVTAVITSRRFYSIASSVASVLIFNFLFAAPKYTLKAYDAGYSITFVIMFMAAFITSSLAVKLKSTARKYAQNAFRTQILFDMNQILQNEKEKDGIIEVTAVQLKKLLLRDIIFYEIENETLSEPKVYSNINSDVQEKYLSKNEQEAALWVMKNNKHAGASTDTFSDAKCLYLSVRINHNVYGVVGIEMGETPLDAFENSIVLSILGECALALENEKSAREKEEAAVLAKNEQLRANLLRAISHDLRTPLTAISGNASNLLSNAESFDEATKVRLYNDIYDDSIWLINLVENLLSVTRIEDGKMNLRLSTELLDEVIQEALQHLSRKRFFYQIRFQNAEEFIFVKIDARLVVQVILNIVDNAMKYTPEGSKIDILVSKTGKLAEVKISDDGPGIEDEIKKHIFDMFYIGKNKIADSRRSLGMGLSLCKSIVEAHGGTIMVEDNEPHGTVFLFTLPVEEVQLNE